MNNNKIALLSIIYTLIGLIFFFPSNAYADCINPPGVAADIVYNSSYNVPEVCNGTEWMAMGALNPAAGGSGCSNPSRSEGALVYNTTHHVLQYCDGDDWKASHGYDSSGGMSFLSFADLADQSLSTLATSGILGVNISGSQSISISGDGSPEYRICADAACNTENHTWTSSAGTIDDGEFLQLRLTSNASAATTNTAAVTVGTSGDEWSVTTLGADNTPDAFGFTDQTDVTTSTLITSNSQNITGIVGNVSVSVSGDGSPQVRINGGSWVTNGTIQNGQSLEIRLTSNAANSTMNSATVTVGTETDQWDVTTQGIPILQYVTSQATASDDDPQDFSNVPIGTASADRLVIVGVAAARGSTGQEFVTGVTIGGNAATLHVTSTGNDGVTAIASRVVPSGTTADISINFDQNALRCAIFVWTLKNYNSATPVDTDTNHTGSGNSRSATLDWPAGAVGVFSALHNGGPSSSWSSAIEDYDSTTESRTHTGAHITSSSPSSPHTETVSWSGSDKVSISAVSWR